MDAHQEYKKIVYLIATIAALGGLLFGLDQGFIGNAGDTLNKLYGLDAKAAGSFNAILATGGILGTICSGFFTKFFGRKNTLMIAGFAFLVGALVSSFLPPINILTFCRFLLGFGVGLASFATPLYLAETAPTKIRGSISTLFQLMITFGILLISLTNIIIVMWLGHEKISLSMMFSVITVFAFLMFVGCFFLPKSPRWLLSRGRDQEAHKVLTKLRAAHEIDAEIAETKKVLNTDHGSVVESLAKKYFWKILIVGVIIQMFQQLVGINMMIYYAPHFLSDVGLNVLVAALAVYLVNFLSTFPAIKWVEKWGRKKLLTVGAVVMMSSLIVSAVCFYFIKHTQDPADFIKYVLLISCLVYIFGFACSWGPVAWTLCSEIFPIKTREIGMTVTTVVNWTFAGVVIANSNVIMTKVAFGDVIIFLVYAAFCLASIFFLRMFVPETKGTSLEKIEDNLISGKKLRNLGQ
ncbi:sugar porter family MFS transporter [Francisella philomiragia]|uniref:sugar porter family MFS transporter n=1 Tax=Francisella philomiragia TaxID=28110 RepID=UPI001B8D7A23|nr:sugar porter family MFS transporter [Francisella philomiragia]QUE32158.1 sugar porter family MFS transporter [Francisella philomiragia]